MNPINIEQKNEFKEFLDSSKEINNLPSGISISTMCATCKLNTELNIDNIEQYLQLNDDDIITIKRSTTSIRSLLTQKTKNKRNKKISLPIKTKVVNYFYNQITVVIRVNEGSAEDINNEPRINLKLFKNGSVQMSGCKSVKNINIVLNKLIHKLRESKAKILDNKIVEIKFIENPETINISNFKIDMINSNYQVNMKIDRDKLYNILKSRNIKCSFEPCIRACVVVKYTPVKFNMEEKQVSIYIFLKGNIIITGARDREHIIEAYDYINNILITHADEINIIDDDKNETLILNIYKDIKKKIDNGLIVL
jgi:TATA-box binding protein (TBP) (component of TFIID and TFIIIB)